jgi:hypothetical protein
LRSLDGLFYLRREEEILVTLLEDHFGETRLVNGQTKFGGQKVVYRNDITRNKTFRGLIPPQKVTSMSSKYDFVLIRVPGIDATLVDVNDGEIDVGAILSHHGGSGTSHIPSSKNAYISNLERLGTHEEGLASE